MPGWSDKDGPWHIGTTLLPTSADEDAARAAGIGNLARHLRGTVGNWRRGSRQARGGKTIMGPLPPTVILKATSARRASAIYHVPGGGFLREDAD